MKKFLLKFNKFITSIFLIGLISVSYFVFFDKNIQTASAGWWNDSWNYRKAIEITNNTNTESDVYIILTIDTASTSISTQDDCGDLRFTNSVSNILPYYIVSGCGSTSTVIHVNFETFPAGKQTIYYYYGNNSVENGFSTSDFSTQASNYTVGESQAEEVGPGPVGYWSFNEGYGAMAHDDSSGGNHGTITGATWKDESECVSGKCLWFDGVDLTRIDADTQDNMNEFTFCTWVKPNSFTNANSDTRVYLISKEWEISIDNSGSPRFRVSTDSAYPSVTSSKLIEINKWQFICGVYNGVGSYPELYIDGIDKSSDQLAGSGNQLDDSSVSLTLGAVDSDAWIGNFNGSMDEVKIYPYARTADQIKQDYNAGLSGASTKSGTTASFGSKSDSWMSDGLVGYWKMDESATTSGAIDASGNGNTGTYVGDASTTAGKFGRGGSFDGTGDYISTNKTFDSTFTYSGWVKISEIPSVMDTLVGPSDSTGPLFGIYDNQKLILQSAGNLTIGWSTGTVSLNTWTHVAVVYTMSTGDYSFYINGNLSGDGNNPVSFNLIRKLYVGSRYGNGLCVNGKLDEVRIYNRALSPDEVKKLYEWAPGPVMHLKMDEKVSGDYKTLYDISGNGNNGTTYGATAAGLNCSVQGKYGSACLFSGALGDYINCGTSASLEVQDHTFSAWIYPESVNYSSTGIIASKADNILNSGIEWGVDDGHLKFAYNDGSVGAWYIATSSNIVLNSWQYVVINWSSSGGVANFYVNGIKTDTVNTTTGTINYLDDMFRIDRQGNNNNFNGKIDDIKLYNYVRTQKQILEDMNGGSPSTGSGQALKHPILDLNFNEGFGETAHDGSGNSSNGTLYPGTSGTNTATSAMWSLNGKNGKGVEFDGTDDYVSLADPSITNQFTISAWIKSDVADPQWKHAVSYHPGFAITGDQNNDEMRLLVNTGTETEVVFDSITETGTTWHHYIGTYDGTTIKTYLDGKLKNSTSKTGNIDVTGDLNIGSYWNGHNSTYTWNGLIDEVKLYNYALSDDEIKTLYNSSAGTVMGSGGTDSLTGNPTNAASGEYCIPGDTSTCDAPILHLKMDEKVTGDAKTLYDISGNGNNGTTVDGANNTGMDCAVRGKYGSACKFDGVDDYVSIVDSIEVSGGHDLSWSAWVYLTGDSATNWSTIFGKALDANNKDYQIGIYQSKLIFYYENGANNDDPCGIGSCVSTDTINNNEWTYVSVTYNNSTKDVLYYINGKYSGSDTLTYTTPDTAANLEIGRSNYLSLNFQGDIDDPRIYNYVRTPAQIAWEYNKGKPIAEWKFDECSGGTIHDNSSNGNHGTLYLGTSGTIATGTCASSSNSFWYNGRIGKKNSSGIFDGLSDYVEILDNDLLDFTNSLTLSSWIKPTAAAQSLYSRIISKTPTGGGNELYALLTDNSPSNTPGIRITIGGSSITCFGDSIAPLNDWTHVLGTWNGSVSKIYFNGKLEKTCSIPGTLPSATSNLRIGDREDSPDDRRFKGMIDEVKMYNYVLTEEQVKNEYNDGAVKFGQ